MGADGAREQKRIFREKRLAERGDYEPERGDYEPERGDYEPERGDYEPERGSLGPGMAGARAHQVATDIFRRAAGLGGHLVVAFVAPIGASATMSRPRVSTRASSSEAQAAAARAHVAELIEQFKQARTKVRQQPPVSPKPASDAHVTTQTSA
jgi:hypothetical protein